MKPIYGAKSILSALSEDLCMRCIFQAAYSSDLTINKAKCTFLARWAILASLRKRPVRSRTRGAVGTGRENLPVTRLYCCILGAKSWQYECHNDTANHNHFNHLEDPTRVVNSNSSKPRMWSVFITPSPIKHRY